MLCCAPPGSRGSEGPRCFLLQPSGAVNLVSVHARLTPATTTPSATPPPSASGASTPSVTRATTAGFTPSATTPPAFTPPPDAPTPSASLTPGGDASTRAVDAAAVVDAGGCAGEGAGQDDDGDIVEAEARATQAAAEAQAEGPESASAAAEEDGSDDDADAFYDAESPTPPTQMNSLAMEYHGMDLRTPPLQGQIGRLRAAEREKVKRS
jgi:hypothetical protein